MADPAKSKEGQKEDKVHRPRQQPKVEALCGLALFTGGGDNEVSESFGAIALDLIPSFISIVHRYNSVIVAIREGGERQAVKRRAFDHASTVGANGSEEGDMHSQVNEAFGELDGRVYMALHGICNDDKAASLLLCHNYLIL
nr:hypothetical protein CFP56_28435 [Quercus suber]